MSGKKIIGGLGEAVVTAAQINAGADVLQKILGCDDRRWCEFVALEILKAVDEIDPLELLPNVTGECGSLLRGEPEPAAKDIEDAKKALAEGGFISLEEAKKRLRKKMT